MSAVGGLLRRARGGAAKYARMTAEDAVELGAVFWQVARRQADGTWLRLLDQPEIGPPVQR